jgi:sirohydrochlorin ferrochelatase
MTGAVILGHGSKAREANEALWSIVEQVKAKSGLEVVEAAFLQFHHPDLEEGVARVIERGADRVVVIPYFLFCGVHLQEDIPELMERLRATYRGRAEILFGGHLGVDPRIADIVAERIREVG